MFVGPNPETTVFGEAVPAYAGTGENHVAVGRPYLDVIDDLDEINTVSFCENGPLMEKGKNCA